MLKRKIYIYLYGIIKGSFLSSNTHTADGSSGEDDEPKKKKNEQHTHNRYDIRVKLLV